MLVNIAPSRDAIYLNSNEGQKYMNQLNYFLSHTPTDKLSSVQT